MQVKIRHKPIFMLIIISEINYKKNPGQNQLPGFTLSNLQLINADNPCICSAIARLPSLHLFALKMVRHNR